MKQKSICIWRAVNPRFPRRLRLPRLCLFSLVLLLGAPRAGAQAVPDPASDSAQLPRAIASGPQQSFHVQGAVVDVRRGCAYFSFTTQLIKTDLQGRLIGSVDGLTGHLGDLALHPETGRIYGSLEYKDDGIGKGIRRDLGQESASGQRSAFYIAVFDGDRIVRPGMDAERDSVMKAVCLPTVGDDYYASVPTHDGRTLEHRYGCSGIDGVTFAPARPGMQNSRPMLYVAYGVYADSTRTDNDYQVLLAYDVARWHRRYEQPLSQNRLHCSGPASPDARYFVYTGNTKYGIQNLAYDAASGNFYAAVYKGIKRGFPNYTLFVIDGSQAPAEAPLKGVYPPQRGLTLPLADAGQHDRRTGVSGWHFAWGATGIVPVGGGYFYLSHNGAEPDTKRQYSRLVLYRWTGDAAQPFQSVP